MRGLICFLGLSTCMGITCNTIRQVYNDRECCENSETDTCLRFLDIDQTTIKQHENGTIYAVGGAVSGVTSYNDLTDTPTLVTSYNDLTDKPEAYNLPTANTAVLGGVKVDGTTITITDGVISSVGGSTSSAVQKYGQLLDIVAGVADGRTVKGAEGDYTLENVIAHQDISSDTNYEDVTGSKITYKPPAGTTEVIYKFRYHMKHGSDTSSWERNIVKLFVGGVQCGGPKKSNNYNYGDGWQEMEWIIQIGTDDMPNGKINSWSDLKEIKMQMKEDSSTVQATIHGSNYYGNFEEDTNVVLKPELEVRAIGLGWTRS